MRERVILHCDMNNFYASVEAFYDPALREVPMAVGGDPEQRHGIVLAKNYIAKKYGVITGEALWQAKRKCPDIIFIYPHYDRYLKFSRLANALYEQYTDQVEPFGLDESWLDVTGSVHLFGSGREIANTLRQRIKEELGITASVGVSYNKIFSKLASDMKKPDVTTEISTDNFKETVWPLPVSELLYIGSATKKKLHGYGIHTIGQLAKTDCRTLEYWFGKIGVMLWSFANGIDNSTVNNIAAKSLIKSIGNSTTTPRDLVTDDDIKITIYMLAESVAARLREHGFLCRTVQLSVRDNQLFVLERQQTLRSPACVSSVIAEAAYQLFRKHIKTPYAVRSLGVRACELVVSDFRQLSLIPEEAKEIRREALESAVDDIRSRFGHFSIQRGIMLKDRFLSDLNPKDDHIIHPVAFLK